MKCAIEPKHNIKSCDILLDSMILRKANILNENSQRFIGKTIIGFKDLSRIDRVCTCVRACVRACVCGRNVTAPKISF